MLLHSFRWVLHGSETDQNNESLFSSCLLHITPQSVDFFHGLPQKMSSFIILSNFIISAEFVTSRFTSFAEKWHKHTGQIPSLPCLWSCGLHENLLSLKSCGERSFKSIVKHKFNTYQRDHIFSGNCQLLQVSKEDYKICTVPSKQCGCIFVSKNSDYDCFYKFDCSFIDP